MGKWCKYLHKSFGKWLNSVFICTSVNLDHSIRTMCNHKDTHAEHWTLNVEFVCHRSRYVMIWLLSKDFVKIFGKEDICVSIWMGPLRWSVIISVVFFILNAFFFSLLLFVCWVRWRWYFFKLARGHLIIFNFS